jgi:hypothetical protein
MGHGDGQVQEVRDLVRSRGAHITKLAVDFRIEEVCCPGAYRIGGRLKLPPVLLSINI